MLPYTGLHHIIFKEIDGALVMTSANRSGEPMIKDNREILKSESADYYLLHSLDIVNRCDDSVLKQVNNRPVSSAGAGAMCRSQSIWQTRRTKTS